MNADDFRVGVFHGDEDTGPAVPDGDRLRHVCSPHFIDPVGDDLPSCGLVSVRPTRSDPDPIRSHPRDLKKFRGQQIVQRIGQTRRYQASPAGLKAIIALIVLRDKAIKPLLTAAQEQRPPRGAQDPTPLDAHYAVIRIAMRRVFHELGIAA
jgi:hypothetical protein